MKIRLALATMGAALLAVMPIKAADESLYQAGEIITGVFGAVVTPDFEQEKLGAGLEIGYSVTPRLVLSTMAITYDTADQYWVDQWHGRVTYRIPVGKSAPYGFVGGGRDLETHAWQITVGIGIEHRFTKNFGLFADAGLLKEVEGGGPSAALARAGLRLSF